MSKFFAANGLQNAKILTKCNKMMKKLSATVSWQLYFVPLRRISKNVNV